VFLAELRIENFRIFGEGEQALVLALKPGLTALVGENDTGKTAIIDALRLALGTRDQEFFRIEDSDFHLPPGGTERRNEIRIHCKFEDLTLPDKGAFSEHLTYEERSGSKVPVLYVNWKAVVAPPTARQRRFTSIEARSGKAVDGPQFDQAAKALLCSTYLRPLRDAERAMSSGRGSRLSQILQYTTEIRDYGQPYDHGKGPPDDLSTLSVLGVGDYANALLSGHKGIQTASTNLNTKYLERLSFSSDKLEGRISVSGPEGDPAVRLRLLLEKLDLELCGSGASDTPSNRGLGSNNILFMACELLLLGSEVDGFPLLLIEEPEAHLHPQRQLQLMQFLQEKAKEKRADAQRIQVIITTHSPNLASAIELDNLVLLHGRKAFPLALGHTGLDKSDYGFLTRFLDVTKANLFFARGLLIVEGDAENILIPTLATLLDRDLTVNGVSIVNVGGTGLRRFARIYLRQDSTKDGTIDVPVACVADFDVMPDCAPEIVGKAESGKPWPEVNKRRWRAKRDFTANDLQKRREEIGAKASGQKVKSFVADEWTLEYDLAFSGLAREVWVAAHLAEADERINAGKITKEAASRAALESYVRLAGKTTCQEELASHVYALFADDSGTSKATAAQYLACLLEGLLKKGKLSPDGLRKVLPKYLVAAIDYVTTKATPEVAKEKEAASGD
jgi:putative ATP-dependent endonuclease of OLD family